MNAEHAETILDDSKTRGETLDAVGLPHRPRWRRRVERLPLRFPRLCVDRRDR